MKAETFIEDMSVFQTKFLLTTLILEGISHAASKAKELVGWSDNAI